MTDTFEYGPIELFVIGFAGSRPGPSIVEAILDLAQSGTVRFLDLIFVTRAPNGTMTLFERDEMSDDAALLGMQLDEAGLAGEKGLEEFASAVEPGTSAAVILLEHSWARTFAEVLYQAGGQVLVTERVSAPLMNQLVAQRAAGI